jgi:hypothetical protein
MGSLIASIENFILVQEQLISGLTNSIRADTVGEFKSAEMGVPHMPAWKAKTLGKLTQERVLLEP